MKLGAVSRHLVEGMGWSLWTIAKSVGVSPASGVRGEPFYFNFIVGFLISLLSSPIQ